MRHWILNCPYLCTNYNYGFGSHFLLNKRPLATMNVQKRNGVSVYCLSSGPSLPEWLGDRARRNLSKKDEAIRRRIELIQDFQMPASSSKLVRSLDGRYIMAAGTYPPRIRCYDVHELTMKFERYVNAEIVDMVMLGEDYGKMALLQEDRTISFHAHYGAHESIRIPTFGRAMAYEPTTCELLIAAKGSQIFRVDLEEGRFSEPWKYNTSSSLTNSSDESASCIAVNQSYPVACVGCGDGLVRFWDNRSPDNLGPMLRLDVQSATKGYGYSVADDIVHRNIHEISAVNFDSTGMFLAAGTAGGLVALYDVRSSRPLHVQEHKHGLPINTLKFHSSSGMLLSSDEKLLKAWRYKSSGEVSALKTVFDDGGDNAAKESSSLGSVLVNIESSGKLSHFIVAGDESDSHGERSGVLLLATDQPKMESYYVPALGVAPKWCSFLESITEELAEKDLSRAGESGESLQAGKEAVYENYKFVSRDDLDQLGIAHLVGTPLLRGYMHGFFMDINLYNRAKSIANPFEYEDYRKKKVKERLEAKRASRIATKEDTKSKVAVNPELAERLQNKAGSRTKAGKAAGQVLSDDRFGSLFTNPDYHIDEEDENFKLRNPSGVAANRRKRDNMDSDDEDESENEENEPSKDQIANDGMEKWIDEEGEDFERDASSESDSDDDGFRGAKVRGEAFDEMKGQRNKGAQTTFKPDQQHTSKTKLRELVVKETDGSAMELALGKSKPALPHSKVDKEKDRPLSQRLASHDEKDLNPDIWMKGGSKQISYIPKDAKRRVESDRGEGRERGRKRRGTKELKLKGRF